MMRMVFPETQPFKGVKNYFADSLLYQESSKVTKQPLPDDIDSGNEAEPESEEDTLATFAMYPLVAHLNDSYYNGTTNMKVNG